MIPALLLACRLVAPPETPIPSHSQLRMDGLMAAPTAPGHLRLMPQSGHPPGSLHLAASPDGRYVATGDASGLVLLWDALEGRQVQLMSGPGRPLRKLVWWAPPGEGAPERLLALDDFGTLHAFHPMTGQPVPLELPGVIRDITVSPDQEQLSVVDDRRVLWLSDAETAVKVAGGGQWVAMSEAWLSVIDRRGGIESHALNDPGAAPIRWSLPAPITATTAWGGWLATAEADGPVRVWSVAFGRELHSIPVPDGESVTALRIQDDGWLLVSTDASRTLRLPLLAANASVQTWEDTDAALPLSDGILLGRSDGRVELVRADRTLTLAGRTSPGSTVQFGDRLLLVGGAGGGQSIWDIHRGRLLHHYATPGSRGAALSAGDARLAVISEVGLDLYTPGTPEATRPDLTVLDAAAESALTAVALSGDGSLGVLADSTGAVWGLDLTTPDQPQVRWRHALPGPVTTLEQSAAGQIALAATEDGHVLIHRDGWWPLVQLDLEKSRITDATLSADGSYALLVGATKSSGDWVGAVWCVRLDGVQMKRWLLEAPALAVTHTEGDQALIATADAALCALDLTGEDGPTCTAPEAAQLPLAALSHRRGLTAGGRIDGGAVLWTGDDHADPLRLLGFASDSSRAGGWAVVHERSRAYDAAFGGQVDAVSWVLPVSPVQAAARELEVLPLSRFQEAHLQPQLLSRFLSDEGLSLPDAPAQVSEPPALTLAAPISADLTLRACLTPRAGGVGTVAVRLSDPARTHSRLLTTLAPEALTDEDGCAHTLTVDLSEHRALLSPRNLLEVAAWSADGTGASQPLLVSFNAPAAQAPAAAPAVQGGIPRVRVTQAPEATESHGLYILAVGISDYPGTLKLAYPAKDAADIASMLTRGAAAEGEDPPFEPVVVRTLLNEEAGTVGQIEAAVRELSALQSPGDTFGLYLAGHGFVDADGEWFYLTQSGTPQTVGPDTALSATTLTEWMMDAPARRQAVILDACAAGSGAKDVQERLHQLTMSRMSDHSGLMILAATTDNEPAYENRQLQNGLLTEGLLLGLKSADLAALYGNEWRVGALFDFAAAQVPRLAEESGVTFSQQPVVARPPSSDFLVGRWHESFQDDPRKQKLAPVTLMSWQQVGDPLKISASVNAVLAGAAATEGAIFQLDATQRPVARAQLWGMYRLQDDVLIVEVALDLPGRSSSRATLVTTPEQSGTDIAGWVLATLEAAHVE